MPSTYTTNNGIELIATGEQTGTWGSTTNTNLSLVDTSLDGHVSVSLAVSGTSGSPNTLPITDGSASNGRNRAIIFTDSGDLGANAYVQLTPNDAKKIMFVRNSLSGSRNLILFQGTYNASNDFVLAAGKDAIVKFNGAGSGAVASAVLADFALDAATIGTADINGGTIDGVSIGASVVATIINVDNLSLNGNTISSTNTNGNITLDPNGTGVTDVVGTVRSDGADLDGAVVINEAGADVDFRVESDTLTHALFVQGSDGRTALGSTTAPLARLEVSRLGGATPTITGGLTSTTALFVHSGPGVASSGADISIVGGNTSNTIINFGDTDDANIGRIIYSHTSDAMSFVVGNATTLVLDDTASGVNYVRMRSGATGSPAVIDTLGSDTNVGLTISTKGAGAIILDTGTGAGQIDLKPGSSSMRLWDDNSSHYYQFVTGDRTANYNINLPAGNVTLTAGTTVVTDATNQTIAGVKTFSGDLTIADKIVHFGDTDTAIRFPSADVVSVETGGTERIRAANSAVVINEAGADVDFRVESDTLTHALFVRGSDGSVGVNNAAPDARFHVTASATSYSFTPTVSTAFILERNGDCHMTLAGSATGESRINFATVTAESRARISFDRSTDIMRFVIAANTPMTIDGATGNVGVGTTTPATPFHVSGTLRYTNRPAAGTITAIGFDANGDLKASSSSLRYKHDIKDYDKGLAEVMQLRPVSFKFNGEDIENIGFIAEEVDALGLTQVVTYNEEGQPEGIQYANMVSLLSKAIQQQQELIARLEARIAALEATSTPVAATPAMPAPEEPSSRL